MGSVDRAGKLGRRGLDDLGNVLRRLFRLRSGSLQACSPLALTCVKSNICRLIVHAVLMGGNGYPMGRLREGTDDLIGTKARSSVVRIVRPVLARRRRDICEEKEGTRSPAVTGRTAVTSCHETAKFRTLVNCLCLGSSFDEVVRLIHTKVKRSGV